MNYIIHLSDGTYFAGWNRLGEQVFVEDRALAYRMLRTVAERTIQKVDGDSVIERLA
ncbi:MAG: hypothetical protein KBS96_02920 [Lachnospiraceae bacterium]|nr:hypothetical protein [Candidatus Colinaster scatohippi]